MIEQLLSNSTSSAEVRGVEFIGEVGVTGFIDGLALASAIGLTTGTAQYSDSPWLHFTLDGVELYVAKRTYRRSVSWDQIDAVGAVFGDKTIEIDDRTYKVRLLKSVATGNTYTGLGGYDPAGTHGSEWNRLFYPIYGDNPSPVSGEGLQFGSLAQYTGTDLVLHHTAGNGTYSWCQETPSSNTGWCIRRGYNGVPHLSWTTASDMASVNGWRPVLELVS